MRIFSIQRTPFLAGAWAYLFPASLRYPQLCRSSWQPSSISTSSCLRSNNNNYDNNSIEPNGDFRPDVDNNNATTKASSSKTDNWMETYLSNKPNPLLGFASSRSSTLSKNSLYDEADLRNLLELHTGPLSDAVAAKTNPQSTDQDDFLLPPFPKKDTADSFPWNPSLHDQVLELLNGNNNNNNNINNVNTKNKDNGFVTPTSTLLSTLSPSSESSQSSSTSSPSWLNGTFRTKISQIRAIASDVDGTLLTSRQTIHPRTRRAILDAIQYCQNPQHPLEYFFLATGKSQKGALDSLGMASQLSHLPGVFLQGLYCVNGDGQVVFEQKLTASAVQAAEQLAQQWNVSLIAYDGDHLYTTEFTPAVLELNTKYGEPSAQLLDTLTGYQAGFHKILLMDHDVTKMNTMVRPPLEALQHEFHATVTQAIPTMLEWLPAGCSKGRGVEQLCTSLQIDPSTELLAIGDAENDVTMLQKAAIGVAVGNASPLAKDAADFVLDETNDQGGAGVAMELFVFGHVVP